MKTYLHILLTIATLLCIDSCSKPIGNGEDDPINPEKKGNTANDSTPNGNSNYDSDIERTWGMKALTVKQAQQVADGTTIVMKGYIIGTAYRSLSNWKCHPPFESKSCILMADFDIHDTDSTTQVIERDDVMAVCINDMKGSKDGLNLVDNPTLWNKRIMIAGTRGTYLNTFGMRRIRAYEVIR